MKKKKSPAANLLAALRVKHFISNYLYTCENEYAVGTS